ncbi:MAG: hypothetical protein EXQ94_11385 [Alphaproteobacteria bacterium]|nr:hypothetical protein [Alphaproteobacteria bacterium]
MIALRDDARAPGKGGGAEVKREPGTGARLRTLVRRWMRDSEFKAEHDALGPEFEIVETLVRAGANPHNA